MNVLDNPIWHALSTEQKSIALGDERARRYPANIGPLSGLPEMQAENFEALRALTPKGSAVALFCAQPPPPSRDWTVIREGALHQMVRINRVPLKQQPLDEGALRRLTLTDAPAMVELARLTDPGPFRTNTVELGTYLGIFHEGELAAMTGTRMRLPGHIEVSAVCTLPQMRGRGYAGKLISLIIEEIEMEGKTAFLHVLPENPAIRLYESLGFSLARKFHLAVLQNEG